MSIAVQDSARTHSQYEGQLQSALYLLRHHGDKLQTPEVRAQHLAIAGVNAARLDNVRDACRYFLRAILSTPWDAKQYVRLLVASVPMLRRRLWLRQR